MGLLLCLLVSGALLLDRGVAANSARKSASASTKLHQRQGGSVTSQSGHHDQIQGTDESGSVVEYVEDGPLGALYDFLIKHRLQRLCLLLRQANLEEILIDTGPLTLFAPTDGSFAFLPGGTLESLETDYALLREFLLHHILAGDLPSGQINDELVVTSMQGGQLRFNIYGAQQLTTVSGAEILEPDLQFELGRVHVIDRPLYPVAKFNIMGYLQNSYKEIYRIILSAGLAEYLSGGTFTFFVPDDKSFEFLSLELKGALATNSSLAHRVVLSHVLSGANFVRGLADGMQVETLGGALLTITQRRGLTFINGVPIVMPDVPVTNGVIHIVNRVLLPDGVDADCQCKPLNGNRGSQVSGRPQSTPFGPAQRPISPPRVGQPTVAQRGSPTQRPTSRPTSIQERKPVSSQRPSGGSAVTGPRLRPVGGLSVAGPGQQPITTEFPETGQPAASPGLGDSRPVMPGSRPGSPFQVTSSPRTQGPSRGGATQRPFSPTRSWQASRPTVRPDQGLGRPGIQGSRGPSSANTASTSQPEPVTPTVPGTVQTSYRRGTPAPKVQDQTGQIAGQFPSPPSRRGPTPRPQLEATRRPYQSVDRPHTSLGPGETGYDSFGAKNAKCRQPGEPINPSRPLPVCEDYSKDCRRPDEPYNSQDTRPECLIKTTDNFDCRPRNERPMAGDRRPICPAGLTGNVPVPPKTTQPQYPQQQRPGSGSQPSIPAEKRPHTQQQPSRGHLPSRRPYNTRTTPSPPTQQRPQRGCRQRDEPFDASDTRPLCPLTGECLQPGDPVDPSYPLPPCSDNPYPEDCRRPGEPPYDAQDTRPECSTGGTSELGCRPRQEHPSAGDRRPVCPIGSPENVPNPPRNSQRPQQPRPGVGSQPTPPSDGRPPSRGRLPARKPYNQQTTTSPQAPGQPQSDCRQIDDSSNPSDTRPLCPFSEECRQPGEPVDPTNPLPSCEDFLYPDGPTRDTDCRSPQERPTAGDRRPLCPPGGTQHPRKPTRAPSVPGQQGLGVGSPPGRGSYQTPRPQLPSRTTRPSSHGGFPSIQTTDPPGRPGSRRTTPGYGTSTARYPDSNQGVGPTISPPDQIPGRPHFVTQPPSSVFPARTPGSTGSHQFKGQPLNSLRQPATQRPPGRIPPPPPLQPRPPNARVTTRSPQVQPRPPGRPVNIPTRAPAGSATTRQPFEPNRQTPTCRPQGQRVTPATQSLPVCSTEEEYREPCQRLDQSYDPSDPRPMCSDIDENQDCRRQGEPFNPSDRRPMCPILPPHADNPYPEDCRLPGEPPYDAQDTRPECPTGATSDLDCRPRQERPSAGDRRPICPIGSPGNVPVPPRHTQHPQQVRPGVGSQPAPSSGRHPPAQQPPSRGRLPARGPYNQRTTASPQAPGQPVQPQSDCRRFNDPTNPSDTRPLCPVSEECRQPGEPLDPNNPLPACEDFLYPEDCRRPGEPYNAQDNRPECPTRDTDCRSPQERPTAGDRRPICSPGSPGNIPASPGNSISPHQARPGGRQPASPPGRPPPAQQPPSRGRLPARGPYNQRTTASPHAPGQPAQPQSDCRRFDDPSNPSDTRPLCPVSGTCRQPGEPLDPTNPLPSCEDYLYPEDCRQPGEPYDAQDNRPECPTRDTDCRSPQERPTAGDRRPICPNGSPGNVPVSSWQDTSRQRPVNQQPPTRVGGPYNTRTTRIPQVPIQPTQPSWQRPQSPQSTSPSYKPVKQPAWQGNVDLVTTQSPCSRCPNQQSGHDSGGIDPSQVTSSQTGYTGSRPGSGPDSPGFRPFVPSSPGSRPPLPVVPSSKPPISGNQPSGPHTTNIRQPTSDTRPQDLIPVSPTGRRPSQNQPTRGSTSTTQSSSGDDSARSLFQIVENPSLLIKGHPVKLTKILSLFQKAGLDYILAEQGPYTVFLPSDDAFAQLPKGVVDQLEQNTDLLRQVLLYHVISTEILPGGEVESFTVPTMQGMQMLITMLNGGRLILISGAKAIAVTRASNGIFYVVNQLLYPLPQEDIVSALDSRPDLTQLASLIRLSGLQDSFQGAQPYTLFAPTDAAFAQLSESTLQELTNNVTALRELLLGHVIEGAHYGREFLAGGLFSNLRGEKLRTKVVSYGYQVNEINIKSPEIVTGTGVIHLIDQVLLMPGDLVFIDRLQNSLEGIVNPSPGYATPGTGYGNLSGQRGYQRPVSGHGSPTSGHGAPISSGQRSPTGHDSPTSGHGAPISSGQRSPGHGSPTSGHGASISSGQRSPTGQWSSTGHGSPASGHGAPISSGQRPSSGHGASVSGHGTSISGHGVLSGNRVPSTGHGVSAGNRISSTGHGVFAGNRVSSTGHAASSGLASTGHGASAVNRISSTGYGSLSAGQVSSSSGYLSQTTGDYPRVAQLASDIGLNRFAAWITNSGIYKKLQDGGTYTVFAPTDEAINALPLNVIESLETDPDQIRPLLQYHIIPQKLASASVGNDETSSTLLEGKNIRFNVYQSGHLITVSGVALGEAQEDGGGSVRLIPVQQVLTPPSGNLLQLTEGSPFLQQFASAIRAAHLNWMLSGQGPVTLFAPSDEAFKSLSEEEKKNLIDNKQAFSDLVKRHMVRGSLFSSGVEDGEQVNSEAGKTLTCTINEGVFSINSIPVSHPDTTATNGVLHVIDQFL